MNLPPLPKQVSSSKNWLMILFITAGALVLLGIIGLRLFVFCPFRIPTGAMSPTLQGVKELTGGDKTVGDHIFVNKVGYWFHEPQRGDIVVFRTRDVVELRDTARGKYYVKRIVGLPGERVSINPPFVCINEKPVAQPLVFNKIQSAKDGYHGYVLPATSIPPSKFLAHESDSVLLRNDEYFVLGDNSPNSFDSRYWGPVTRKAIVGRVTSIYWPPNRAGRVE